MSNFIKGIVEEYEEADADGWLVLRHASGRLIGIFDPRMIGVNVTVGESYEVILYPFVYTWLKESASITTSLELWHGVVTHLSWSIDDKPPNTWITRVYRHYSSTYPTGVLLTPFGHVIQSQTMDSLHYLSKDRFVLLSTPFGDVIQSQRTIENDLKPPRKWRDTLKWAIKRDSKAPIIKLGDVLKWELVRLDLYAIRKLP